MKTMILKRMFPTQSNIRFIEPGGALMGSRFDFILVLDNAYKSDEERYRLSDWVESAVRCRLVPGGELVWI